MNTKTIEMFDKYALPLLNADSRVLEVGSLDVNGSVSRMAKKVVKEYIGIDMQEGPAVDRVVNSHDLLSEFGSCSFDMVICFNTLEHDDMFWETLESMYAVLKTGGYLVLTVPDISFSPHRYPDDYYRFTETAVKEVLFNGYDGLVYDCYPTKEKANYLHFCMGRKV